MSGRPRPYHPDADAKDTRGTLRNTIGSDELWLLATREPVAFLSLFEATLPGLDAWKAGELLREMHVNVAQAQWARTRGVYQFDPALAQALDDTPLDGLSDDVLTHLPEWAVYLAVGAEMAGRWLHGGFVSTVREPDASVTVSVVAVVASGESAKPYIYDSLSFRVSPERPLTFVERFRLLETGQVEEARNPVVARHAIIRFPAIHELLLVRAAYLCTERPDVRVPREPKVQPQRKKNNGPVRAWEVGARFGQAYHQALAGHEAQAASWGGPGERARPRPHVRRAHWRTVLSGPLDQARRRDVRWFPPTFVNAQGDEVPVTIWKQRKSA